MAFWVIPVFAIFLQTTVHSIRVDDSSSKFLIVAKPQDSDHKEQLRSKQVQNDLHRHIFDSNRSRLRIRQDFKYPISPPTIHSINLLDVEKSGENVHKSAKLKATSVEIAPAQSQYLGYTVESQLNHPASLTKPSKKESSKKDQSVVGLTTKKHSRTRHTSVKPTKVKAPSFHTSLQHEATNQEATRVENTIHRPKTNHQVDHEKPIQEYFSSDLSELIEKAHHLDTKTPVISTRKLRNSEYYDLGHTSDKSEVEEYLGHQSYRDNEGEPYGHTHEEKKKKKEIHYHQHKHLHDHDHDQKHSHKHQSGHHHDHGHDHRQKHEHAHGHDDDHWHEHHEKGKHHHDSHHDHDHHGSHDHMHHEDHDHKHDHGHHHGHVDHHDHHEDHKNWHSHKHHGDHDHHHDHDHRHKGNHDHGHKHGHKHKHSHYQKHGGKH